MSQILREKYFQIKDQVAEACRSAGRAISDVRLLAVSKFQPLSSIVELAQTGQRSFGENYVQEALAKRNELDKLTLDGPLEWHMIGHVQSRKAGLVAGEFELVHTLDSIKLADAMERHLRESGREQKVLLEVNIGEEPQKAGVLPQNLEALGLHVIENCPHLQLCGLMCLPPVFDSGEAARPYFASLRRQRDKLESGLGVRLPELSMGMSGDFGAAIREGASIVRIGSGIFGPRPIKSGK